MMIRRLAMAGLVTLLLLTSPARPTQATRSAAKAPWPVAGVCLQPADPDTTITLRSLRVEITLVETQDTTLAQVWARFSLVNPSRTTPVQAVVGLPTWSAGDRFFRSADIQGLTVTVNDTPVTPTARPRPQVENETWPAWDMSFDILDRQFVEVTYTTPLEAGATPRVAFALSSGAIWANQVESAAMVITAPRPFHREQVLDPHPADARHDGRHLSWHFVTFEPAKDVGFTYITRGLWERVEATRAALTTDPSAANHRALGLLYLTLVDRAAFFAQAVAELETAARLDPTDVETHRALAQAYQAQGLATNEAAYLELAIRHWNQVRTLAPGETAANTNLRRCHYALAQLLSDQRAYRQALEHLEAAQALPATDSSVSDATLAQLRDRTRRTWAAYLFEIGQEAAAVAVLRPLGAPYEADYQAYAPAFARVQGQVTTRIAADGGARQIVVTWTPFATAVLTDAAALATALQTQVPAAQVRVLPDDQGLDIALSFASPAALREMLASLGQGVPISAVWDPVRAILVSGEVSYDEHDSILWREVRYRETLPLHAPATDLLRRRQALTAAITELTDQAGNAPDDPVALRLAALQSYRTATDRLLASRVSSRVTLTGLPGHPQASLDATLGEDRVLEAGTLEWNLLALALVGGSVALILLLLLGLAWRRFHPPATAQRNRAKTTKRHEERIHMPINPPLPKAEQDQRLLSADDDTPTEKVKPSFVERMAWREEQEAIERGSDEFRDRRQLAEALTLEPDLPGERLETPDP